MNALEPIQIWLLMAAVAYVAFMAGRASANGGDKESRESRALLQQQSAERIFSELSVSNREHVDRLVRDGKTIEAIKSIRMSAGVGLRDAKRAVDWRKRMMKG